MCSVGNYINVILKKSWNDLYILLSYILLAKLIYLINNKFIGKSQVTKYLLDSFDVLNLINKPLQ